MREDDVDDVFQRLRFPILLELFLFHQLADVVDFICAIAVPGHNLLQQLGVMLAAGAAPFIVTVSALRKLRARNIETADVLTARGDAQQVGGVRVHCWQSGAHALGVHDLVGPRRPGHGDGARVAGIGRIDVGKNRLVARLVRHECSRHSL